MKHVAQYPSRRRPGPLRNSSVKEENGLAIASLNGLRFDAASKSPPGTLFVSFSFRLSRACLGISSCFTGKKRGR